MHQMKFTRALQTHFNASDDGVGAEDDYLLFTDCCLPVVPQKNKTSSAKDDDVVELFAVSKQDVANFLNVWLG